MQLWIELWIYRVWIQRTVRTRWVLQSWNCPVGGEMVVGVDGAYMGCGRWGWVLSAKLFSMHIILLPPLNRKRVAWVMCVCVCVCACVRACVLVWEMEVMGGGL
jgi:hypothetical protein